MEILKQKNGVEIIKLELDIAGSGHITNSYIVYDIKTRNGAVIDPGYGGSYILSVLKELKIDIKAIIVTHVHGDHIGALEYLYNNYKGEKKDVKIYMHAEDVNALYNDKVCGCEMLGVAMQNVPKEEIILINEPESIVIDLVNLEVIHAPGHTAGSIVLYEKTTDTIISGDTIFARTYGRTDLATGNSQDMKKTLDKLFDRFDDIDVYPGHDEIFNLKDVKRKIRLLYAYKG